MKSLLFFSVGLFSLNAFANLIPSTQNEFCSNHQDKTQIQDYLEYSENLMSFKNDGGVFNGGVCWWHSRFQRNMAYLAIFNPSEEKLQKKNIRPLLNQIRNGKTVVHIPGFSNVRDFTQYYQKEIQTLLNDWQILEGGLQGGWQRGIQGKTSLDPKVLIPMMDRLYEYVERQKKVAYQKLQIKGITAHAWLVHRMKKMDDGYILSYVDSNSPQEVLTYHYKNTDRSFNIKGYGNFIPYLEFVKEEERLTTVAKSYCQTGLNLMPDVFERPIYEK
jgi:hypothetical protein